MSAKVAIDETVRNLIADSMQRSGHKTISGFARKNGVNPVVVTNSLNPRRSKSFIEGDHLNLLIGGGINPTYVDSGYFRDLVRLWTYVHNESQSSLAKKLNVDQRAFNGAISRVKYTAQQQLEQIFLDQKLTKEIILNWLDELSHIKQRYSFKELEPLIKEIESYGIGPTAVVGRHYSKYRDGEVASVPANIYDKSQAVLSRLRNGDEQTVENVRAELYGNAPQVLYSKVKHKLFFLRANGVAIKPLLGRSIANYESGKLKAISQERAQVIDDAIKEINNPIRELTNLLANRDAIRSQDLDPLTKRYLIAGIYGYGYQDFSRAHSIVGMSQHDFNLYVNKHADEIRPHVIKDNGVFKLSHAYIRQMVAGQMCR